MIRAEGERALNDIKAAVSRFGVRGVDYLTVTRYLATLASMSQSVRTDVVLVPSNDVSGIAKLMSMNKVA